MAGTYQPVAARDSLFRAKEFAEPDDDGDDGADFSGLRGTAAAVDPGPPLASLFRGIVEQRSSRRSYAFVVLAFLSCAAMCVTLALVKSGGSPRDVFGSGGATHRIGSNNDNCPCAQPEPSDVPQYFRTWPPMWAGPTATGKAPFLAQTVAWDPAKTYVPNEPLQTAVPVEGMGDSDESIFKMMGYLSPYQPAPGFGVDEYPLPRGAEIVQVHMLSRHGSRYPTLGSQAAEFGKKLAKAKASFKAKGALAFLNDWEPLKGHEILVAKGRQELFDSGVLHAYNYLHLYDPTAKLIVRTTTQWRMLQSAEYWLAGFFGLDWTNNATIEVMIESNGFNTSLAGYDNCPNANGHLNRAGANASDAWRAIYLEKATNRLADLIDGYNWTIEDSYACQQLCAYETVAYGYSVFCSLFSWKEWQGFSYSIDLAFAGGNAFQSPTGRAVGKGWQQELVARLRKKTLGYSHSQINVTLDNNTDTFPLSQSLYFDFSHDTNIMSILTALGLRQFSELLPIDKYPGPHNLTVSHIVPFGARLDIEIIRTPKPVRADRRGYVEGGYGEPEDREDKRHGVHEGGEDEDEEDEEGKKWTHYIHFILNQRTLPLGASFPECDPSRLDGWCELDTFLKVQEDMEDKARYDFACFGDYPAPKAWGEIMDGAPL